ncbi:MAG: hypothetical protein KIT18_11275 [Burkholderiales bacterium]|nr:hypothetical protein [Burkholderiales bacterium]
MKNLLCTLLNCHAASGWHACARCQLRRVKLMRQLRHRRRAAMLGIDITPEICGAPSVLEDRADRRRNG